MSWIFNGNPISEFDKIEEYEGFCYMVEDLLTNTKYIGKKSLWSYKKTIEGRKKVVNRVKSNWKSYRTSCKKLADEMKRRPETFVKTILSFHTSKADLTISEVRWQFIFGVLESDEFENNNIGGRYYRQSVKTKRLLNKAYETTTSTWRDQS